MTKSKKTFKTCQFEGCSEKVYARGYCRRHYNQLWRKGKVGHAHASNPDEKDMSMNEIEHLRALERELKRARQMYSVVCGLEGRVKWRRDIDALEDQIAKLKTEAKDRNAEKAEQTS